MSVIYKNLKKSIFYPGIVLPGNLKEGDLVIEQGNSFAVAGVLKPEENKINFFKEQNYNKSMEKIFSNIKEIRTDYVVFLVNYTCNVLCRTYHPLLPIAINRYIDNKGIYNREEGLNIWLLKFSIDYVSMRRVISNPIIYNNFIKKIDNKEIRDELEVISSLMALHYS